MEGYDILANTPLWRNIVVIGIGTAAMAMAVYGACFSRKARKEIDEIHDRTTEVLKGTLNDLISLTREMRITTELTKEIALKSPNLQTLFDKNYQPRIYLTKKFEGEQR